MTSSLESLIEIPSGDKLYPMNSQLGWPCVAFLTLTLSPFDCKVFMLRTIFFFICDLKSSEQISMSSMHAKICVNGTARYPIRYYAK